VSNSDVLAWLGLEAMALAWLLRAMAFRSSGQAIEVGFGLLWLGLA